MKYPDFLIFIGMLFHDPFNVRTKMAFNIGIRSMLKKISTSLAFPWLLKIGIEPIMGIMDTTAA